MKGLFLSITLFFSFLIKTPQLVSKELRYDYSGYIKGLSGLLDMKGTGLSSGDEWDGFYNTKVRIEGKLQAKSIFLIDAAYELTQSTVTSNLSEIFLWRSNSDEWFKKRRLIDPDLFLISQDNLALSQNIDRLFIQISKGGLDIYIGRQAITFGVGRIWSPADVVAPFNPVEFDRETKPGVDALRLDYSFENMSIFSFYFLPEKDDLKSSSILFSLRTLVFDTDLEVQAGMFLSYYILNISLSGNISDMSFWLESATAVDKVEKGLHQSFDLGTEYSPFDDLDIFLEYYRNGFGTQYKDNYLNILLSKPIKDGLSYSPAIDYIGGGIEYRLTDLIQISAAALGNTNDGSFLLIPLLNYSASDELTLYTGGIITHGEGINQGGTFDEYGVIPDILFVQMNLYF